MTDRHILETRELLRPDEVAGILRVSKRTVYRLCADGELDCTHARRRLRVKTESIRKMISEK